MASAIAQVAQESGLPPLVLSVSDPSVSGSRSSSRSLWADFRGHTQCLATTVPVGARTWKQLASKLSRTYCISR